MKTLTISRDKNRFDSFEIKAGRRPESHDKQPFPGNPNLYKNHDENSDNQKYKL